MKILQPTYFLLWCKLVALTTIHEQPFHVLITVESINSNILLSGLNTWLLWDVILYPDNTTPYSMSDITTTTVVSVRTSGPSTLLFVPPKQHLGCCKFCHEKEMNMAPCEWLPMQKPNFYYNKFLNPCQARTNTTMCSENNWK